METPFKTPNCELNVCVIDNYPDECGNGIVDAEEPCDGHIACDADC